MSIDVFGFRALWSPYFFSALVLVTIVYLLLTGKYRGLFKDSKKLTPMQTASFVTAMVLLYVIKGSPVDLMGHIMFSYHMTQMAFLYLVIAPLFLLGVPAWLWRAVLENKAFNRFFSFVTKPLIALIVFNVIFSIYHIPLIFDFVKMDMWLHGGYTVLLFILALFMWFPLINPLPERESLSGLKKVGYIFGSGILMTPACALIIFANHPLFATFSDPSSWASAMELCVPSSALSELTLSGPEVFSGMKALDDQQLGGVLMKTIQEIVLGVVLGVIFFAWYKRENGGRDKIDPIPAHLQTK